MNEKVIYRGALSQKSLTTPVLCESTGSHCPYIFYSLWLNLTLSLFSFEMSNDQLLSLVHYLIFPKQISADAEEDGVPLTPCVLVRGLKLIIFAIPTNLKMFFLL